MTYQQAAQMSLDVQNACNLSGVVHDLPAVMDALWEQARIENQGTAWVNAHPIVTLFLDKMASLNRTQCLCDKNFSSYSAAAIIVEKIILDCQKESEVAA